MNTPSHLEESLQRDMDLIRAKVSEMAGLSERALRASLQALVQRNRQLAYGGDPARPVSRRAGDRTEPAVPGIPGAPPAGRRPVAICLHGDPDQQGTGADRRLRGKRRPPGARRSARWSPSRRTPCSSSWAICPFACCGRRSSPSCRRTPICAWRTMAMEEQGNTLRNSINAELMELSRKGQLPTAALESADDHRAPVRARDRPGQEPVRGGALHVHGRIRQAQGRRRLPHPVL